MKTVVLLVLLATPALLNAQQLDATDLADGKYNYEIEVRGGKVVAISPTQVFKLTPPGQPQPTPDPTPPPVDPTSIENSVKTITLDTLKKPGATKQTAAGLSAAYSAVSAAVSDGSLSVVPPAPGELSDAQKALGLAIGIVLGRANATDRAAWEQWRVAIGTTLTQMANNGDLSTKAQWAKALDQIHKGIDGATGVPINVASLQRVTPAAAAQALQAAHGQGILDGIDIATIIELIKLILELFKLFKPM